MLRLVGNSRFRITVLASACLILKAPFLQAQKPEYPGQQLLDIYFADQVAEIEGSWHSYPQTHLEWESQKGRLRRELKEMLGLWPEPPRGDLRVRITGTHEREGVIVENLVFQSVPGLYVTANLYRPAGATGKLPAVLYVCGHATVKEDGIAYGSKVNYQHHPAWFARHGYVSLILDTLQLGEIEGIHHGTYREGRWWWVNRGYTSAGIEAWNAIRAVDYLEGRSEVDPTRIAMTGRSGGGITTWWAAALDDRIAVAVPVAGITDLHNHVVDGVVEGHCDCMYFINKYRWSFSTLAALIAPRPLLLENSDKDTIFPLDGVLRIFWSLRENYQSLYDRRDQLALTITPGPHRDTQEIRVPAFHWIDRWLRGEDFLIDQPAKPLFSPRELKVFDVIPDDQLNTRIDEVFVPEFEPGPPPSTREAWMEQREKWKHSLLEGPFSGWPAQSPPLHTRELGAVDLESRKVTTYSFESQRFLPLSFWVVRPERRASGNPVHFRLLGEEDMEIAPNTKDDAVQSQVRRDLLLSCGGSETCVFFAPRGIGRTAWDPEKTTHIRRRFILLGQTLDGMRVWDISRALKAVSQIPDLADAPVRIQGSGNLGVLAAYASVWEPLVQEVVLASPPSRHRDGPTLAFISKIMDIPQAVGLLLPDKEVELRTDTPEEWAWLRILAERISADLRVQAAQSSLTRN